MEGHKTADHSLIHDRMNNKTIHEDMYKKEFIVICILIMIQIIKIILVIIQIKSN